MSATFVIDEQSNDCWTADDEVYLHDVLDLREAERELRQSMTDYWKLRNARNGDKVRLLVPHPFQGDVWTIWGPAPEPGFFYLACRFKVYQKWTGVEQCFHDSEFEAI